MVLAAAGGTGEYVALCQLQRSHRLHFSLSIVAFRTALDREIALPFSCHDSFSQIGASSYRCAGGLFRDDLRTTLVTTQWFLPRRRDRLKPSRSNMETVPL